jgi:hypothetical protein
VSNLEETESANDQSSEGAKSNTSAEREEFGSVQLYFKAGDFEQNADYLITKAAAKKGQAARNAGTMQGIMSSLSGWLNRAPQDTEADARRVAYEQAFTQLCQ